MHARAAAWVLLAALAACNRSTPVEPRAPGKPPPNILVVVLDTLRPDHLGCYGSSRPTSPRLDSLAQRSCLFENAQSAAPLTVASLLSLVSSLYPAVHGVQGELNPGRMSEHVTTLAEVLAAHGYTTAAFTEGGYANPRFGLGQGFQTFPASPNDSDPNVSNLLGTSRLSENLARTQTWLRGVKQPFFLFFHTYEVHQPNYARQDYMRMFRPGFDEAADHARTAAAIQRWDHEHAASEEECQTLLEHLYQCPRTGLPDLLDPDGFERLAHKYGCAPDDAVHNEKLLALVRDLYDGAIRYTDDQLELLWNLLDELQLQSNTILVVVSDHGEGLGEHERIEHSHNLHEEALHVVLLIHAPGQEFAPRRVKTQVRSIDVMPTLLELAGIDASGLPLQGESLVPLMLGHTQADHLAFSHARHVDEFEPPQFSVRDGRWRLIVEPKTKKQWLYDHENDPSELKDVSGQYPEVLARLSSLIEQQRRQDEFLRAKLDSAPGELVIDEQTMQELKALGYTGKEPK
ncbi:MAG: sulfatase [Planctomycetes bacterium]|nr:sulfatase [Planctomycetota bacterium]